MLYIEQNRTTKNNDFGAFQLISDGHGYDCNKSKDSFKIKTKFRPVYRSIICEYF